MTNQLITPQIVAKESLMVLENNMVLGNLVHRDYSNEFVNGVGDTVNVRKPATFITNEFTTQIEIQDAKEASVPVKLDTHLDVSFEVTAKDLTLNISDFSRQFIQPAVSSIAQAVDVKIAKLYQDIPFTYGIALTTPGNVADITGARKVLNGNKAPMTERSLVLDPEADAKFLSLDVFNNADKVGDNGTALREGSLGRKFGFNIFMDQNIQNHDRGTLVAASANIVVKGAVAAGSSTLTLKSSGATLTGTLVKGDLLVIDGVNYLVAKNTTASGNEIAVTLAVPTYKTISDLAVVGVVNPHTANLAFHKNAFAFVSRPLALPMGNKNAFIMNYNGLSIRVVQDYNVNTKKDVISLDLLGGFKTLSPELAVRLLG
ncbi:P22 phage major capsid protein family protein [Peribacillus sp. JNUCC 23]